MAPARDGRIGLAALVATYLVVFGTALVGGVRALLGNPRGPLVATWADRITTLEGDAFYLLVVIVVLRWLGTSAPECARRVRLRRTSSRTLAAGVVGYVAVATVSGWLGTRVTSALHWTSGPAVIGDRGATALVTGLGASVAAAVTEEVVLVAMTAAAIETMLGARLPRAAVVVVTVVAVVALRWSVHLYYLGGSVFVLAWAPATYLLYRWTRSVWPLALGHAGYDVVLVVAQAWPRTAVTLDRLLWTVTAAGGVLALGLIVHARRVRAPMAASPSS